LKDDETMWWYFLPFKRTTFLRWFGHLFSAGQFLTVHISISCQQHDIQGRFIRKPVNANPGLKVNRGKNFSSIKGYPPFMF